MKTGLAALLHPKGVSSFLESFKSNKPFVVHKENDETIKQLFSLPFLSSLEGLINSWPWPIQAHLPDVRDEASSIDTNAKDAKKLFDNGLGLLFNDVQNISPVLEEWLADLKRDLGISSLTYGRCLIYATPHGKGTAAHFDQNINFVLQVHGTKRWHVAPNNQIINPMTRHTIGLPIDPEMMSYMEEEMPNEMPEGEQVFELRPGSLLFVPRGCWHSTEAQGDALSLNFTFTAPTWADLFLAALRSRLILSPEWRETADLSEEKFDQLLQDLAEDIPFWKARDILGATES